MMPKNRLLAWFAEAWTRTLNHELGTEDEADWIREDGDECRDE